MGVQVLLDADAGLLIEGVKAHPALIKPNDEELSRLTGRSFAGIPDMARAALELVAGGIETVVVSLGGEGALFARNGRVLRGHGLKVPVLSTVGAGDSMMAAMCYGAASGQPFEKTCVAAMAVSAASVMCSGTQAASPESIQSLLAKVRMEEISL